MIELKTNIGTVRVLDDIETIPQITFQKWNECIIQDSGLGSTLRDVDLRFQRLDTYLVKKDFDAALQERKNLHQTIFNAFNGIDYKYQAFACLVQSIGKKKYFVATDDDLEQVLKKLSKARIPRKKMLEVGDEVKKKYLALLDSSSLRGTKIQE